MTATLASTRWVTWGARRAAAHYAPPGADLTACGLQIGADARDAEESVSHVPRCLVCVPRVPR